MYLEKDKGQTLLMIRKAASRPDIVSTANRKLVRKKRDITNMYELVQLLDRLGIKLL